MSRKENASQRHAAKPQGPSTGQGAASALDAMIKRRAGAPAPEKQPHREPRRNDKNG
jgi:hypothetical protein